MMAGIKCLIFFLCFVKSALVFAVDMQKDLDYTNCALNKQVLFIEGIKNTVETSDPLAVDNVPGNFPGFKYQLKDAKFMGLKDCTVTKLRVNKEKFTFDYNLECPRLEMNSKYVFTGELGNITTAEEGDLTVTTGSYIVMFHGYYEKKVAEDNKEHAHIKYYSLDYDVRERLQFKFTNFVAVDEDKADAIHEFMNDNWKKIDKDLRAPVFNTFMDVFIHNLNDFLKAVPIEEVFKASCVNH